MFLIRNTGLSWNSTKTRKNQFWASPWGVVMQEVGATEYKAYYVGPRGLQCVGSYSSLKEAQDKLEHSFDSNRSYDFEPGYYSEERKS